MASLGEGPKPRNPQSGGSSVLAEDMEPSLKRPLGKTREQPVKEEELPEGGGIRVHLPLNPGREGL